MHSSLVLFASVASLFAQSQDPVVTPAEVVGPTYRFADFDGDQREDVYLVDPAGGDRLFKNLGDGSFEDVTDARGLAGLLGSRMAVWFDFDRDGSLDLYVAHAQGRSRLFQNTGQGLFVDVTAAAGLQHRGAELFARALDYDGDSQPDLHLVTEHGDLLFRNLGRGEFGRARLPAGGLRVSAVDLAAPPELNPSSSAAASALASPGPIDETWIPPAQYAVNCSHTLLDQATSTCTIEAASTPQLGRLYPLSPFLNISFSGNVGMGTTTPLERLEVVGSVRASGRLVSTVATGTPPLSVASTTKVNNLNADTLDGVDSITFTQLGQSIESSEITNSTIVSADLATGAVQTGNILDATILGQDIASGTITGLNIQTNSVDAVDIADGSLTGIDISDGTIGPFDIALSAVNNNHIANGTILMNDIGQNGASSGQVIKWSGAAWAPSTDNAGTSQWSTNGSNVYYNGGDVGIGTNTPVDTLALVEQDPSLRLLNLNDPGLGAFVVNTWGSMQLGMVNTTGATIGSIPANTKLSLFGVDQYGRVGSMSNTQGQQTWRNFLDDGTGTLLVDSAGANAGSLTRGIVFGADLGVNSGEGIASNRTTSANQYGLDLYTGFTRRISITNLGKVGIGTHTPSERLSVVGSVHLDEGNANTGTTSNALGFGNPGSGEGIGSKRNVGGNQNGLDFYTFFTPRMSITNAGFVGIGTTAPTEKLDVLGATRTQCLKITGGCDLAEPFEFAERQAVEPGMVVTIDPEQEGKLRLSTRAYDTTVAGVISGAGGVNTGMTMSQQDVLDSGEMVALAGRVYCWCDASFGAIRPGDLLTSSDTAGHAMKASDRSLATGAIIGKALTSLTEGRGLVLIVVSLQ